MSKANEPAFPQIIRAEHIPSLTKREHFAAMAMQGVTGCIIADIISATKTADQSGMTPEEMIAVFAVECADALLLELSK